MSTRLGVVALMAAPSRAQQGRGFGMFGGGGTALLTNKGVQKELKVTDEQASKLGAGGLIGVQIEHDIAIREVDNGGKREDLIVTFHILGTAIAPAVDTTPLAPKPILRQGAA